MKSFLLQPWTTVQATSSSSSPTDPSNLFNQDDADWLDVSGYADAAFVVDVRQTTAPAGTPTPSVQITFQTAPSKDDALFQPVGPAFTLAASSSSQITKSVSASSTQPMSRWLRWQLSLSNPTGSGNWGTTFRVRAVPYKQSFFTPTQIPGCALWLRADLGVTLSTAGGVNGWSDQSQTADPNRNLVLGTAPGYLASSSSFNNKPVVTLASVSSQYLVSLGSWSNALEQPNTWVYVANNTSTGATAQYIQDGNDASTGQAIEYTPGASSSLTLFANGSQFSLTGANLWSPAAALLGEWNGGSSNIYFNNFTTPSKTGTVGGGSAGGEGSMTFGSHSQHFGGMDYWDGNVAEIVAYSGILTAAQKARLRLYLNGRYNVGITT